jgi:ABC-2 type transport system permease protein
MISVARVRALLWKELAEVRRNRGALFPVFLVAFLSMVMPFLIAVVVPHVTGDPLSGDGDVARALEHGAIADIPRARLLSPEGAAQAFIFSRFVVLMLLVPVTGAIAFAGHSLISEKQGRSLEPLLATPITTVELLIGKTLGALVPSLLIMLGTFAVYGLLIHLTAEPGVLRAVLNWKTLLLVFALGPITALVSLQVGVLVSARVNDARTAQQFGALLIFPLTLLFLSQMTGAFVLSPRLALAIILGLALVWLVLLRVGVWLFQRESILTRWK